MDKDVSISLRLEREMLSKIDSKRGDVSRSIFIRKKLQEAMK